MLDVEDSEAGADLARIIRRAEQQLNPASARFPNCLHVAHLARPNVEFSFDLVWI
jgi:hypothetical protein